MEQGAIKGGRGSPFISGPIESVFFPFFFCSNFASPLTVNIIPSKLTLKPKYIPSSVL